MKIVRYKTLLTANRCFRPFAVSLKLKQLELFGAHFESMPGT